MKTAILTLAMLCMSSLAAAFILLPRDTTLTHRAETTEVNALDGTYEDFQPGYLAGKWELFKRDEWVTLSGTGYIRVRWEIEFWQGVGPLYGPTYEDVSGTFVYAAGGGGYQMSDQPVGCPYNQASCANFTGSPDYGYSYFPDAINPWHNEYYYLDGQVTITNHESGGAYNVGVQPISYDDILSDINTAPTGSSSNDLKYGYSYDPSAGSCPCSE